jgi:tetratricopeptide (TPR) repeat protein
VGRREHRLRRVTRLLILLGIVAVLGGYLIYRSTRPETRRPGEELPEITQRLALDLPEDAPSPKFADVTHEAGLGEFDTFKGGRTSQLPEDMGSGAAWGDFDNDGDDDLFLVGAGGTFDVLEEEEGAASCLYENDGGQFRCVADFPETRLMGMGAAWGDYDGDGWLDLVVSGYGRLLLFHNEQGRLVQSDKFDGFDGWWSGVTWGDFDNDRDLDLYVCGYVVYEKAEGRGASEQYGAQVPYTLNPASFEPQENLLLQNDGSGNFTDVAALYGVSNPGGRSLGALWHDFDEDGLLDLYVANDISDNALYMNLGETFEDQSLAAWVADYRGAMGLTAGDWDRDSDDDLFITHWIAQENALYDSRLADLPDAPQLTFSDLAAPLGLGQIALQSVGWGTEFADFDGDGWLDLVVNNGSTLESGESAPGLPELERQAAMLFWNERGKAFHDLAPLGLLQTPHVGRGLALSDYDLDGDLDILKVHLGDGVQLLRNDMQTGNWLELRLRRPLASGSEGLGFAPGARVTVYTGETAQRRTVGSSSYLSQSSQTLHFGLGEATSADRIEVRWPAGEIQEFAGVPANSAWELVEGESEARRLAEPGGGSTSGGAEASEVAAGGEMDERQRLVKFWETQRAGMDAFKRDGDCERASELFREALALNPEHGDSRYYLANCLVAMGDSEAGLAELDELRQRNPGSHRAHKQWGVLRAVTAESEAELMAAQAALERSLEINLEETGALLALGEVELLLGENESADERFAQACHTNPKAVGGFFLRGYLAWKGGDPAESAGFLEQAVAARGPEWKPEGTVAEGDVAKQMHSEFSPLSSYWEQWDGSVEDPASVFASLDSHLAAS